MPLHVSLQHEVHWRDRGGPRKQSRTDPWLQTVFKIQERSDWNSHLRYLWDSCILLIEKCRCVLGISTRVRP